MERIRMPSMNEIRARVRAAHLLVRSAEEWDTLSGELFRAYDSKDNDLVEMLRESFLAAWKSVTRNLLTDTLDAAGITVTPASHPWGIATLQANGRNCQPLLCTADGVPKITVDAVYGGLRLQNFEEVIAGYGICLTHLLPSGPKKVGARLVGDI